jgi:acetyl esterase/lipase
MVQKCALAIVIILLVTVCAAGQQQAAPLQDGQVLRLWSGAAPGALGTEERDIPVLTVFLPRTLAQNTPAVIICPGGGYANLASNHEGRQVANYLNSLGFAAFVLRYRLGPRYHHPIELGDAQRAIRTHRHSGIFCRRPSRHDSQYPVRCR